MNSCPACGNIIYMEKGNIKVTDYFYRGGLNCAESTMKVFTESGIVDAPSDVVRMMTGFGGGMQRGSVCGAVIASVAAIGWKLGRTNPGEDRRPSADGVKQFLKEFESEFGTIYCGELQRIYVREHALKSEGMYRACTVFVEKAVEISMRVLSSGS